MIVKATIFFTQTTKLKIIRVIYYISYKFEQTLFLDHNIHKPQNNGHFTHKIHSSSISLSLTHTKNTYAV